MVTPLIDREKAIASKLPETPDGLFWKFNRLTQVVQLVVLKFGDIGDRGARTVDTYSVASIEYEQFQDPFTDEELQAELLRVIEVGREYLNEST
jgi:hypothetical protein